MPPGGAGGVRSVPQSRGESLCPPERGPWGAPCPGGGPRVPCVPRWRATHGCSGPPLAGTAMLSAAQRRAGRVGGGAAVTLTNGSAPRAAGRACALRGRHRSDREQREREVGRGWTGMDWGGMGRAGEPAARTRHRGEGTGEPEDRAGAGPEDRAGGKDAGTGYRERPRGLRPVPGAATGARGGGRRWGPLWDCPWLWGQLRV